MKKYLWFLAAFLLVVLAALVFQGNNQKKILGTSQEITPAVSSFTNFVDFSYKDKILTGAWYKVSDPFRLTLIANFEEKENAKDIYERQSCKFLTNAGFYTADYKPIGLFISEGGTLRKYISNKTADGIFSINYLTTPRITRDVPKDGLRIALQTGPVIKENSFLQKLNISSDKEARRVIAGVTGENELYFIVLFDKSSAYMGPLLGDLPDVLKTFEEKAKITFADAINLDGGSASAFYTNGFSLSELSPVGAFLCEK